MSAIPVERNRNLTKSEKNILHEGRLGSYAPSASSYTSSIDIDGRLLSSVIKVNTAHVVMLSEQKIIKQETARELLTAIAQVPRNLTMRDDLEDVHMNVENFVISKIGMDSGGMMNLAKSRNDQVATALRMALKEQLIVLGEACLRLEKSLLELSVRHAESVMPGYTHLQRGQPVTLGHHLLAHFDSLDRDFARLVDCYLRTDLSPMGAGALATTGFEINRERVAELLGFEAVLENSLDAVSSRDFATEAIYVCTQFMTDVSRLAEELILWSTKEFSFAEIPDEFSSTSSMMPQKKNAIVPEIFRAKTSQVLGDFVGAVGIVRSLPLSYNLDLQELTRNLWSATDKTVVSLSIISEVIRATKFNEKALLAAATTDELLFATELADMLVGKYNLSFREAHLRVGKLVRLASDQGKSSSQLTGIDPGVLSETLGVPISQGDLASVVDAEKMLRKRTVTGSPNPKSIPVYCRERKKVIEKHQNMLSSFRRAIETSGNLLDSASERILKSERKSDRIIVKNREVKK